MKVKPISEITAVAERVAGEVGVEVVDVEFKISSNPQLTVFIDTEDGVDLITCERYHNAIDPALDELDPTFGSPYTLNVSSPGLDRPFKTERDFQRALGLEVEVKLYAPMKGKKFLEGVLTAYDGNTVTVEIDGAEQKIELTKVAKINKAVKFD
jgi:ribosome maturation factor RimP